MINIKRCKKCQEEKIISAFYKAKSGKDGYSNICKTCIKKAARLRSKSLSGLITSIYASEKRCSKRRGHPNPTYTKKELTKWLYNAGIQNLYINWKKSGYQKEKAPSVDRLNSNLPYTLQNIRLVTWKDNDLAGKKERKSGKYITKNCKKVNQLNTDKNIIKTFETVAEASRQTGTDMSSICKACSGKISYKAGGFYWAYAA